MTASLLPALLIALIAVLPAHGEEVSEPQSNAERLPSSLIEVIADAQLQSTQPLIDYCLTQDPNLQTRLLSSYEQYQQKVDEAMAPLVSEYRHDPDIDKSPEELQQIRRSLKRQAERKISALNVQDPSRYCRWMIKQLDDMSVDTFRAQIREGYELMKRLPSSK